MSASHELQKLIIDTLKATTAVSDVVGFNIYDQVPTSRPYPCIEIAASDFVPGELTCLETREEAVQIDVWHRDGGRLGPCRVTVDAVIGALHRADLSLPDPYALIRIVVVQGRVFRDRDGITAHGVVSVEADIEVVSG